MRRKSEVCDPMMERRQTTCELTALFFRVSLLALSGGVLAASGIWCVFPLDFDVPAWFGFGMALGSSAGILAAIFLNDQQLTDVVGGGLDRVLSDFVSQMISSMF
ncbi:MAG: hypothetical protein JNL67_16520 [Planctomycetaceae bacterium]|nr:hypothetical protein [Planctomycetaceae bacterium]